MKTVLYNVIDGLKIITGFALPTVDPVETNRIVDGYTDEQGEFHPGKIHETPEHQAAEAKKAEFYQAINDLKSAAVAKDEVKYRNALEAMKVRQEELRPLARARAEKIIALRLQNAVHFEPRTGEVIMAAAEADERLEAIQNAPQGTLIALGGSIVEDNRGKVFFRRISGKWGRTHIVKLGDKIPSGAILEQDVTETQRTEIERDRVRALPEELRMKEREKVLSLVLKSAGAMRSDLEIQGDPDALQKSQDWYQAERARLETLYG